MGLEEDVNSGNIITAKNIFFNFKMLKCSTTMPL